MSFHLCFPNIKIPSSIVHYLDDHFRVLSFSTDLRKALLSSLWLGFLCWAGRPHFELCKRESQEGSVPYTACISRQEFALCLLCFSFRLNVPISNELWRSTFVQHWTPGRLGPSQAGRMDPGSHPQENRALQTSCHFPWKFPAMQSHLVLLGRDTEQKGCWAVP